MTQAWMFHAALELVGGGILRCLFLLCAHDHFYGRLAWMNVVVHSRWYRYGLWLLLVLLTSYVAVQVDVATGRHE